MSLVKENQKYPEYFRVADAMSAAATLFPNWDARYAKSLLADFAENPCTIVLSTHLIEEIADLLEHLVLIDRGRILADADADDLRASAISVSGRGEQIDQFLVGRDVMRREGVGQLSRAVVRVQGRDDRADASALRLNVGAVSLQQLVVSLTNHAEAIRPAPAVSTESADLEEVSL